MKAGHGEISGRNWGWWAKTDVDGSIHAVEMQQLNAQL